MDLEGMKDLLSVGELSGIFGLNVQTLHFYEREGLLAPSFRTESGHRKYRLEQIYQLASIRFLRRMGHSIDEIRSFLNERTPEITTERLKEQAVKLHSQAEELLRIEAAIRRKIQYIEHKQENLDPDRIERRWFPERRYIPVGSEVQIFGRDEFYLYPTIAFYEKDLKYFGVYVEVGMDGLSTEPDELKLLPIPAGDYLVGCHIGPYSTIRKTMERIRAVHPEWTYGETTLNFNIIDQFIEKDPEKYVTEIQIPVTGG